MSVSSNASVPAIELVDATKRYGDTVALDAVSLVIEAGEFFCLLGPSGCGKTTTLNLIGGFIPLSAGELRIEGRVVNDLPPHKRNVNTVFQSYALFPHMTVAENVAFGLKMEGLSGKETRARVAEYLGLVGLERHAARRPMELSGGQQQRVALARALAKRPAVLLLDEPLGALDLKLRRQMQAELSRIHRQVGTTFVFVTHDQEEALSMATRIAVMSGGHVAQVGTAGEIYDHPRGSVRGRLHRAVQLHRRHGARAGRRHGPRASGRGAAPGPIRCAARAGDAHGPSRIDGGRDPQAGTAWPCCRGASLTWGSWGTGSDSSWTRRRAPSSWIGHVAWARMRVGRRSPGRRRAYGGRSSVPRS